MTALDNESLVVHGTCHHDCPDSCGWHVTVQRRHRRAAARQPRAPVQRGRAVPEGQPVHRPRLRPGPHHHAAAHGSEPKGEGRFEPITWDEALDEIGTRFTEIVQTHGAEAIMPYLERRQPEPAGDVLRRPVLAPARRVARPGRDSAAPWPVPARTSTNGTSKALDPSELRHSKLIILWGTNTRLTNRHLWPTIDRGPRRRRQGRRHRPDPHDHRRRRRLVHPAAARHRRRPDAGDDARPGPRRPDRSRVGRRSHARLRRAGRARRRVDAAARRRRSAASTPPTSRRSPARTAPPARPRSAR